MVEAGVIVWLITWLVVTETPVVFTPGSPVEIFTASGQSVAGVIPSSRLITAQAGLPLAKTNALASIIIRAAAFVE